MAERDLSGTEIVVLFKDYMITCTPCQLGTVAYARTAAFLCRFPFARVTEKLGRLTTIKIEINENVPPEWKDGSVDAYRTIQT